MIGLLELLPIITKRVKSGLPPNSTIQLDSATHIDTSLRYRVSSQRGVIIMIPGWVRPWRFLKHTGTHDADPDNRERAGGRDTAPRAPADRQPVTSRQAKPELIRRTGADAANGCALGLTRSCSQPARQLPHAHTHAAGCCRWHPSIEQLRIGEPFST